MPFHWNDEHGEYLTINAVTNDAVDPESLQPEFKVCAVSLRPVKVVGAPSASDLITAELGLGNTRPTFTEDEKLYLAGFLTGIGDEPAGVPVLPAGAPVRDDVRLWIDGLLAGRYIRAADGAAQPAAVAAAGGPLVLWASQTGNAEEFAGRVAERIEGAQLVNMDDVTLPDLAAARDVLVVTSTFGDGGPPDNGAAFWDRLRGNDAPTLAGVRLRGDRHRGQVLRQLLRPRQVAGLTSVRPRGDEAARARRMRGLRRRTDARVGGRGVTAAVGLGGPRALGGGVGTVTRATTVAEPFTRAKPVLAPLARNTVLTGRRPRRKRCASSALTSPSTTSRTRPATRSASSPATTPRSSTRGSMPPDCVVRRRSRSTATSSPYATR